jgi:hypothetical protein
MRNTAAKFIDLRWSSLARRAMLTVMMIYMVGFAVAALVVVLAVWREASCSPNLPKFHPLLMVSIAADLAERDGQTQDS